MEAPKIGPVLSVRRFPGGFSNLTYCLQTAEKEYVLRRPPLRAAIQSAHDMGREYRVLHLLKPHYQKMTTPDAFCDNDAARRVILEALAFWKIQLDPVPQPTWAPSTGREVIALRYTNDHEQLLPKLKALADQCPNDESVQSTYAEALVQAQQFAEAEKPMNWKKESPKPAACRRSLPPARRIWRTGFI